MRIILRGKKEKRLFSAIREGDSNRVKILLSLGAKSNFMGKHGKFPIHVACEHGNIEIVKLLLAAGAPLGSTDYFQNRPIHIACQYGHTELVKFLLQEGSCVNVYNCNRASPLFLAAKYGHLAIVQLLIDKVPIDRANLFDLNPFQVAVIHQHFHIIEYLIKKCRNSSRRLQWGEFAIRKACLLGNLKLLKFMFMLGFSAFKYSLHQACMKGHLPIVEFLLEKDITYMNLFDREEETPMMIASKFGFHDIVKILLDKGAYIGANKFSQSPLQLACRHGHFAIVKLLISKQIWEKDKSIPRRNILTADLVSEAAGHGHLEIVKYLFRLSRGALVKSRYNFVIRPIILAAGRGDLPMVRYLCHRGVDVNVRNLYYTTAMHLAAKKGYIDIVRTLLSHGADVHGRSTPCFKKKLKSNEDSSDLKRLHEVPAPAVTPILLAAQHGHLSIVRLLIANGANINDKDPNLFTPIILASKHNHTAVVEYLCDIGANVNDCCQLLSTSLVWATMNGNVTIAKLLISNGADVHHTDVLGNTPILLASNWGYDRRISCISKEMLDFFSICTSFVELLLSKGADVNSKNYDGKTAIMYAVRHMNFQLLHLLLCHGADIYASDRDGRAVFDQIILGCCDNLTLYEYMAIIFFNWPSYMLIYCMQDFRCLQSDDVLLFREYLDIYL